MVQKVACASQLRAAAPAVPEGGSVTRQRGTQVVVGAVLFFEGQSSLLRLAASYQVTARLTRPHIPGLASFGPFPSR